MQFVQHTQTIRVTNFDRLMTKKKIRKHGNMSSILNINFYARYHLRSNCDKINVLISLLENPHGVRFENVYVYSKSLQ